MVVGEGAAGDKREQMQKGKSGPQAGDKRLRVKDRRKNCRIGTSSKSTNGRGTQGETLHATKRRGKLGDKVG